MPLLLAMIHPEPSCTFIPHAKRMHGQCDGAVRIQCGRRVTARTQSRLQSVDAHESSQNEVVWPFFTFTFVFVFFADLPARPAWAQALGGGVGGWAGEALFICFQDACSPGPGMELSAQGTGERNVNLEQETWNKGRESSSPPCDLLWKSSGSRCPRQAPACCEPLPACPGSPRQAPRSWSSTCAGVGFPLKLNMFFRYMKKKSVFPPLIYFFFHCLAQNLPSVGMINAVCFVSFNTLFNTLGHTAKNVQLLGVRWDRNTPPG